MWTEFYLDEIATVFNGKTPSKLEQRDEGYPVLKIKDVSQYGKFKGIFESFVDDEIAAKSKSKLISLNDTLILNAAHNADYVGSKQYRAEKVVVNSLPTGEWLIVRADARKIDSIYLNFWFLLDSTRLNIRNMVKGIHLYPKDVARLKIPLPTLIEQQKIAAILDAADSLRQKDQQLVERYTALSQSLFLEMFGDPVTNPMGWDVNLLKDLSKKISSGNTPKGGSNVYVQKGILFLRSQNVWRNKLELNDIAYIDEATHGNMKKTSLKYRDILMTKTGRFNTENSSLGRAAMFSGDDDTANINGHVYLIRLKEKINNEFVLFILTTKQYRDYIRKVCVGGIDKRQINKDHLENFPIIAPPSELQEQFTNKLAIIEQLLQSTQASLKKSENLFQSLLQKAFTGELTAKLVA